MRPGGFKALADTFVGAGDGPFGAAGGHDLMAFFDQLFENGGAEIAERAGENDFHDLISFHFSGSTKPILLHG